MDGLKYFFSFIDAVPPRFATPIFSIRHLAVLSFLASVYIILTVIFMNKNSKVRSKYLLVVALLLPLFYIANDLWLVIIGHFTVQTELPLQLCGVMYIIIPVMVFTRNRFLMEFVYACGMPGAFLAMLTPRIQGYYFISWGFLGFMVIHSLIVYIPVFMLITGEFRPRSDNLGIAASMFVSLAILDLFVDYRLGTNYLYLRFAPKGTLLDTFASWAGTPGYIFLGICAVGVVWMLLYVPWELFYRVRQQQALGVE